MPKEAPIAPILLQNITSTIPLVLGNASNAEINCEKQDSREVSAVAQQFHLNNKKCCLITQLLTAKNATWI